MILLPWKLFHEVKAQAWTKHELLISLANLNFLLTKADKSCKLLDLPSHSFCSFLSSTRVCYNNKSMLLQGNANLVSSTPQHSTTMNIFCEYSSTPSSNNVNIRHMFACISFHRSHTMHRRGTEIPNKKKKISTNLNMRRSRNTFSGYRSLQTCTCPSPLMCTV